MEVLVSVSSVPEPNSIELAVAHVVALDLAHNFSVSSYLSMEVVLMFHARLVEVEEAAVHQGLARVAPAPRPGRAQVRGLPQRAGAAARALLRVARCF